MIEIKDAMHRVVQGLAFPGLSKLAVLPPFFSMLKEGAVDWGGFSLWLNPNTRSATAPAGELIFGGADVNRYAGQIKYPPQPERTVMQFLNDSIIC